MTYTLSNNVTASLSMTPGEPPQIAFSAQALQRLAEIETAARGRTLTAAQAREAAALFSEAEQAAQHSASMAGITLDTSDPIPHFDSADATADYIVTRTGTDARAGRLNAGQARTARELFTAAAGHLSRQHQPRRAAAPQAAVPHHDAADKEQGPGCSCDAAGICTHVDSHDPNQRTRHMADSDEIRAEIERQRKLQEAQQRRSRAPLQMTKLDAVEVTPTGASAKPKPERGQRSAAAKGTVDKLCLNCGIHTGADKCAGCGSTDLRPVRAATQLRSFASVPGALTKEVRGPFDGFGRVPGGGDNQEAA